MTIDTLTKEALALLQNLISTPSFSREEDKTASILFDFMKSRGISVNRSKNNVWAINKYFDENKPTILLNSHHDTVKPNSGYTKDPFAPIIEDDKLFGLGSNDAGGCLVSLIAAFRFFYERQDLKYNLIVTGTAEEEVSGYNGISSLLPELGEINFAIVGEPTQMNMAIAEKGLMVLDCTAVGKSGHAARNEGVNSIYIAIEDIEWIKNYRFPKESDFLGPIKMSVTIIAAGSAHNVVPEKCTFTVDVRTTDAYSNEETLKIIKNHLTSDVSARSTRLNPSFIAKSHPIVKAGEKWGCNTFGSPTTSDQSLIPYPSVKIGPGHSGRSHTADEFIYVKELEEGIEKYISIIKEVIL